MRRFKQIRMYSTVMFISSGQITGLEKNRSFQCQASNQRIVICILPGTYPAFFRPQHCKCTGRKGKNIAASQSTDLRAGLTQFRKQGKKIRMNVLRFCSFRKIQQSDRDSVIDHCTETACVIRMQMSQNNRIRREPMRPQITAQGRVVFTRVDHPGHVLIPEYRGVCVTGAELDILCTCMRDRKQRENDQRCACKKQSCAESGAETDESTEGGKNKHHSQYCEQIRGMKPKRKTRK